MKKQSTSYNLSGAKKSDEILSAFAGKGDEFTLFAMVEQLGELLSGDIHIIDNSEKYPDVDGEQKFRVYHKNGFCFDVEKRANYDVETDEFKGWEFDFFSEWDGFEKCTIGKAIELVKSYSKT